VPTVLKSGSLNLPEPSGSVQTCSGVLFFLIPGWRQNRIRYIKPHSACNKLRNTHISVQRLHPNGRGSKAKSNPAATRYDDVSLRCVIPVVLSNNKNKLLVHMYVVTNTTIFIIVRLLLLRYNYMFRPSILAIFRLYMKYLTISYIYL